MRKNLLKSFLFVCLGLITAIVLTSARIPMSPPDAPGTPLVIDVHKDQCTIRYSAPKNTGGAPIIGYFIEKKDELSREWIQVNKDATSHLEYNITNLVEGSRLQFRVIAMNVYGESPASKASDVVTIRDLQ